MRKIVSVRRGLVCALAASCLAGAPAVAQEGVAIKNLLGTMGLIPPEKDPIRYRERAPLVLPPKMELREPAGAETFASSNPQWPNDPDVAAKRRRAAEARKPVTESEIRRMSENNPRLSIDEIRAGRSAGPSEPGRHKSDRDGVYISPAELEATARNNRRDVADAGPAVRRTLTDPPSVLRQSARGGAVDPTFQGRVDQQELDANPMNWLTRVFRSRDDDE